MELSQAQIYSQSYMTFVDALSFQGENEKWDLIREYLPIFTKDSLILEVNRRVFKITQLACMYF